MARWSRDRNIASRTDPWESLRRELDRARRYGRPLGLIQITGGGDATVDFLRSFVRAGDEVWRDRDRIFVMLPEADQACAAGMVERLRVCGAHALAGADVRLASFPDDGLTAVGLLDELSRADQPVKRFPARRVIAEDARLRAG
jgi:hypothetical protein